MEEIGQGRLYTASSEKLDVFVPFTIFLFYFVTVLIGFLIICLFKEFPVVFDRLEKLKGGQEAKNECDKVIDKNGTSKTGGNGIKQLREIIAESKLSYENLDDATQAFLKVKIMDNIHKSSLVIKVLPSLGKALLQLAGISWKVQ